jgi:hypothetical protein
MTRAADGEHWSGVASEWIEWARAPNHDAFWAYREALTGGNAARQFAIEPARAPAGWVSADLAIELRARAHRVQ